MRAIFNLRFIPAGAGNTLIPHVDAHAVAVYPRWRGEHRGCTIFDGGQRGLSPLARGTLFPGARYYALGRFIPAGAGNTLLCASLIQWAAVYPRWRGEHAQSAILNLQTAGLSPLARGTLKLGDLFGYYGRFIPAGAGNTLNITYY